MFIDFSKLDQDQKDLITSFMEDGVPLLQIALELGMESLPEVDEPNDPWNLRDFPDNVLGAEDLLDCDSVVDVQDGHRFVKGIKTDEDLGNPSRRLKFRQGPQQPVVVFRGNHRLIGGYWVKEVRSGRNVAVI